MKIQLGKLCRKLFLTAVCTLGVGMLIMLSASQVMAADLVATTSIAEGYEGDIVKVTVSLKDNPGVAGAVFKLRYDESVLKMVGIIRDSKGELFDTIWTGSEIFEGGSGFVGYANANSSDIKSSGTLFEMKFKIVDGATIGSTSITLEELDFSNAAEEVVEFTAVNSTVTVLCKHTITIENTIDGTCTENGKKILTCDKCNEIIEETEIFSNGHLFDNVETVVESTCTEAGKGVKKCTVCNLKEDVEIVAKGHTFGKYKVTREAAQNEVGEISFICTECDETVLKTIPALKDVQVGVTAVDGSELKLLYTVGDAVEFSATGMGMENINPEIGDIRFVPVLWKFDNIETTWNQPTYTASLKLENSGNYKLILVYAMEIFGVEGWKSNGQTIENVTSFKVTELEMESNTKEHETTKIQEEITEGKDINTGDNARITVLMLIFVAAVSGGVMIIYRKKIFV